MGDFLLSGGGDLAITAVAAGAPVAVIPVETDLGESLDSLRYLVAIPGTFSTAYPDTTDDMLLQVLMDGFAETQLMGLMKDHQVDTDGIVTPRLGGGQLSMVLIFAAVRFMRTVLLNTNTAVTYKAGSAEYHTENSASLLRDILADLAAQKKAILALLGGGSSGAAAFFMADQYLNRVVWDYEPGLVPAVGW